ncbi:MAG: hypothetical protein QXT96_04645, partial [Candidatus Bathyarchaeia archaeon]
MKDSKRLDVDLRRQKSKVVSIFLAMVVVLALLESAVVSPAYSQLMPQRSEELIPMFKQVLSSIDQDEIMRHIA